MLGFILHHLDVNVLHLQFLNVRKNHLFREFCYLAADGDSDIRCSEQVYSSTGPTAKHLR